VTFWIIVVLLCLAAIGFAVWPLWRKSHRLTPLVAFVVVMTVALSAAVYDHVGSPGVPSGRSGAVAAGGEQLPGMDEAVATLEKRLENNPDDVNGWKMLGRTQLTMGNFDGAVAAFERAMELENGQVAQTLVDLALAIANRDGVPLQQGRAVDLLENALKLDGNNPAALFYSGMAAANNGDTDTAATLWERLLGQNPPEDIRGILEQNIAAWRGTEPPPAPAATAPASEAVPDDAVVSARVSLSNEALAAMPAEASVFFIARDPAVPTPPIAVSRLLLSELPTTVSLTDAQSMVEGRNLSAFAEIELLARVSLSGGPAAQSGDWFGSLIVRPAESDTVSLTIDQQVP
jgi:cytochrome c-type biogenesis protein CcmH